MAQRKRSLLEPPDAALASINLGGVASSVMRVLSAQVHALGGTKAYGVDTSVRPVRVLTVVLLVTCNL